MKRRWVSLLLLAIGGYFCFSPKAYSNSNSIITVQIDGLKEAKGQICFSLFASSKGFPDSSGNALQAQCILVAERSPRLTIENLNVGNYALAVFHDANQDGKLNRNFLGIPSEGFGFSQNPVIQTGPPKFQESAVLITGTKTNLQVQLRYF
ncbi:MAG: DUF2141 domain-containing protein [Xenococcaceae cyanobacterium]